VARVLFLRHVIAGANVMDGDFIAIDVGPCSLSIVGLSIAMAQWLQ
jgi:hypothetical protein